jgi:hypothetical protein
MTSMPTHFEDKHKLKLREEAGTWYVSSVDIMRIIEKMCEDKTLEEAHVKTEVFEIRIKR